MTHHSSSHGFTLIELLIVIAIIGILATVVIPNLFAARNRAHDAAAQTCAKELLIQGEIYAIDQETYVGYDASNPYWPRSCDGDVVTGFTIDTATGLELAGTVTSKSGAVFDFDQTVGIRKR